MDALAEFTAMSPPREDGEDGGEMRRRRSLQDSAQSLDENFSSSQCSTDPSAFASFQATPGASLTRFPSSALLAGSGGEKRVRLTLDLMTAAGASTSVTPPSRGLDGSQPFGGSHFSELFSADTQDDEGRDVVAGPSLSDRRSPAASFVVAARVSAGSSHEEPKQSRRSTPPPSLLASVESAWLQRKRTKQPADCGEPVAGGLTDESRSSPSPRVEAASSSPDCDVPNSDNDRRSSIPGSSEYSEGLVQFELNAARIPTLAARKPAAGRSTSKETVPVRAPGVIAKQQQTGLSSERANDADEDEVACTEGFDNEHFASKVTIQGKATPDKSIDDESPQADTYSDTGTEPYVPSDDERDAAMDEEETEQFPNAEVADQGGSRVKSADDGMMAGGDLCSADAKPKYTTKREDSKLDNSSSLPGSDAASNADTTCQVKDPASSPTALANSEFQEPESRGFSDADEDDDDYPPTQPSKAFYSNSMSTPMEEEPPIVVPPKVALKKRDKVASTNQPTLTESQEKSYEFAGSECRCGSSACQCDSAQGAGTKSSAAIRNLEFSFAMPESQDTEPSQRNESVPDIDQVASKALQVFDQGCHGGDTLEDIVRGDKAMTSRKTTGSDINKSWQPTPKKAKKMQSPAGSASQTPVREASQQSVEATPTPNRKRKRVFTPSGSTQDDAESSDARATVNEVTPSRPPRRSVKRLVNNSTSSTPSSSQKVRTRPKELSPLPSTRAYISRSRTIFKFKFVFVVTGFSNKGETSMAELIQEHGGKVAEREQNVLYRGNTKAVVIATPVAWRKLKFMQAVACGISVVHPEWIHRCIKAASVLPFDGYTVPSGYSISTRKFECFPVQQLSVFSGYTFGITTDVSNSSAQPKEMAHLVATTLKACGAFEVHENLTMARDVEVDIVLCNEYTETCNYYAEKLNVPVKNFSWVTECVVLQQFIEPNECDFEPPREGQDTVLWANAVIGDLENSSLKLHVGELILADLSRNQIDHFLLFHVCEIIDIFLVRDSNQAGGGNTRRRRTDDGPKVVLRVGVLKRSPYSAGLSRRHSRVLEIPSTQVKRRVVAVSKTDFDTLQYRDESVFFFEDEDEDEPSPKKTKKRSQ